MFALPNTVKDKAYWAGLNDKYSNELPSEFELGFAPTEENKATWKEHYEQGQADIAKGREALSYLLK